MIKQDGIPLFNWINFDWHPLFSQPRSRIEKVKEIPSFKTLRLPSGTLFVGGIGPGNFSSIQKAIDIANDGDTIYVFNGTYYENVIINKSITLQGEEVNKTVIDGTGYGDIISIVADHVSISGFTITNGHFGILIDNSYGTFIVGNIICNNLQGVSLQKSYSILISNNTFSFNQYGIRLYSSGSISIYKNNFIGTYKTHAFFTGLFQTQYANHWDRNYWNNARLLPYLIPGKILVKTILIPWLILDWHPAQEPYEIL